MTKTRVRVEEGLFSATPHSAGSACRADALGDSPELYVHPVAAMDAPALARGKRRLRRSDAFFLFSVLADRLLD